MSTRCHGDRIAALAGLLASALLAGHACDAADECEGSSCRAEPGDDGWCERDADCDAAAGEVCDTSGTVPACSAPGGGGTGGGGAGSGCQASGDCRAGENCVDGACIAECPNPDAYPDCGLLDDTCERARMAPPGDPTDGPRLFYATQDAIGAGGDSCTKDPANCQNNGNVCQFTAGYYDPQDDVGTSKASVYRHLFFIIDGGSRVPAYDADAIASPGNVTFRLCYDEAQVSLGGAVQLDDDAGHRSNATCLEGAAP